MENVIMEYKDLYNDFVKLFPDDIEFFRSKEEETGADTGDGIHVVFAMVVVPFVKKTVFESPEKAEIAFKFFEEMERSSDPKIAEVLEFTVLENLLTDDQSMLPEYKKFFGEETKKAAETVAKWYRNE